MSRNTKEKMVVFSVGAAAYTLIELLWRQHTHWSMTLTGGTCFTILYQIYNRWKAMPLTKKCLIGSGVITAVEFVVGVVVNIWQKCLLYSSLWFFLSIPIVYISKKLKIRLQRVL